MLTSPPATDTPRPAGASPAHHADDFLAGYDAFIDDEPLMGPAGRSAGWISGWCLARDTFALLPPLPCA